MWTFLYILNYSPKAYNSFLGIKIFENFRNDYTKCIYLSQE